VSALFRFFTATLSVFLSFFLSFFLFSTLLYLQNFVVDATVLIVARMIPDCTAEHGG